MIRHRLAAWVSAVSLFLVVSFGNVTALAQGSPKPVPQPAAGRTVPGRVIVGYSGTAPAGDRAAAVASVQGRAAGVSAAATLVELPPGADVQAAISTLKRQKGVRYVEPDYIRSLAGDPAATAVTTATPTAVDVTQAVYYSQQWGLTDINASQAWADLNGAGTAPVTVAVVDSGVDVLHPDLQGRLTAGYDFIHGQAVAPTDTANADDNGHGTHVAGIIVATGTGVAGVAGSVYSPNVMVMPVKVMAADGTGDDFTIAQGIRYAADNGAKIINLSLGGAGYSQTLADAVLYAQGKGALVVAAAGNNASLVSSFFPAALPNVLTVAAEDQTPGLASFSNFGPEVEVAAPGVGIWSTVPPNVATNPTSDFYAQWDGTSMAAPFVSGTAALVAAEHQGWAGAQLYQAVVGTVKAGVNIAQPAGPVIHPIDADGAVKWTGGATDPLLTFGQPAVNEAVAGLTKLSAVVSAGNTSISEVRFTLDGGATPVAVASAPTGGIFSATYDFSSVADGPRTLSATGYDVAGAAVPGAVATVSIRVANAQPSGLVLKVLQPDGQPAGSADVTIYHVNDTYDGWVTSARTNQQGVLELPSSLTPDGSTYLVLVNGREESPAGAAFAPYFYHRTVTAPATLTIDGSRAVLSTIRATDINRSGLPAAIGAYLVRPTGTLTAVSFNLDAAGTPAYLDKGTYDLVAYNNTSSAYLWTAKNLAVTAAGDITLDGAQTVALTVDAAGTGASGLKLRLLPSTPDGAPEPNFDAASGPVHVSKDSYYFGFALRVPHAAPADGTYWYYNLSGNLATLTPTADQTLTVGGGGISGGISVSSSDLTPGGYVDFEMSFVDAYQHELRDVIHEPSGAFPYYWSDALYRRNTQAASSVKPVVTITPNTLTPAGSGYTWADFDIPSNVIPGSFSAQAGLDLTAAGAPWGGTANTTPLSFGIAAAPPVTGPTVALAVYDPSTDGPYASSGVSSTILRPLKDVSGKVTGYDWITHPAYTTDANGLISDPGTGLQKDDVILVGFGFVLTAHRVTQADIDGLSTNPAVPIALGHTADMAQVTFNTDTLAGLTGLQMEWVSPDTHEGITTYTESWYQNGAPVAGPATGTGWFSPGNWNFARVHDAYPPTPDLDSGDPYYLLAQPVTLNAGTLTTVNLNKADAATVTLTGHAVGPSDVTADQARLGLQGSWINNTFSVSTGGTQVLLLPGTYGILGELSRDVPEAQGGQSHWYVEVNRTLTVAGATDTPAVDLGGTFSASLALDRSTYSRGDTVQAAVGFADQYGNAVSYVSASAPDYVGYQAGSPSAGAAGGASMAPNASSLALRKAMKARAAGFTTQNHNSGHPFFTIYQGSGAEQVTLSNGSGAAYFKSATWTVPSDASGGTYTARISLDMGPEAAVAASQTFTVSVPQPPAGGGGGGGGISQPPASPASDSHAEADLATEGGSVATQDRQVELEFPEGALPGNTRVTIDKVTDPANLPPEAQAVSDSFSFNAAGVNFNHPVTVTFRYDTSKLAGVDESQVGIYRYDDETGKWVYVGGRVDKANHSVSTSLNHFSTYAALALSVSFTDLKGHWAEAEVQRLASRQIINGQPDGSFKPEGKVTRAEIAKMLVRARISQQGAAFTLAAAASRFADVGSGDWFAGDVSTASLHGIIRGSDGRFRPNDSVTREELATMIVRTLGAEGAANGLQASDVAAALSFTDARQVSPWALRNLALAVKFEIIRGADGRLMPQGVATRAEAAAMLNRMVAFMEGPNAANVSGVLSLSNIEGSHYELSTADGIYVLLLDSADVSLANQVAGLLGKKVSVSGYRLDGYTTYQRGPALVLFSLKAAP